MSSCISSMLLSLILIVVSNTPEAEARCPDGYHMSSSGDCEKVPHTGGGLPRCPDGYHRSPSGDCEQVSSGEPEGTSSRPEVDSQEESRSNNKFAFPSDVISLILETNRSNIKSL